MRNLQVLSSVLVSDSSLAACRHIAIDYDTKLVYCTTGSCVVGLDVRLRKVTSQVSLTDSGYSSSDGHTHIISTQYLFDRMSLCVITSAGDILLWNVTSDEIECVGSVSCGIKAAAWSPDLDLVVIITGEDQLLLMTREFDPLDEVSLYEAEFGEAQLISVGWGRKETQFHGSEGKSAAAGKEEPLQPALQWDDRQPRISWRGDGQYFVVTGVNPTTGVRQQRVWSREGVLHSTSEATDGLGQAVAYKPSGGLITSTMWRRDRHLVVFFEKNGLRKNNVNFELAAQRPNMKVVELLWNLESTVLAVWCETLPPDGSSSDFVPHSYVDLYTMSNYHWYLKQRLDFDSSRRGNVSALLWDPELAYCLHIALDAGHYLQYTWTWTTNHSTGQTSRDLASVAVIDGDRVLMTPFRTLVIPPPMSAFYLQMAAPVTQVAFCHSATSSNDVAVLMCTEQLVIYTMTPLEESSVIDNSVKIAAAGGVGFTHKCQLPKLKATLGFPEHCSLALSTHHLLWVDVDELVYCKSDGSSTVVCSALLDWNQQQVTCRASASLPSGASVAAVTHSADSGSTVIELADGRLFAFTRNSGELLPWKFDGKNVCFPHVCQCIALCTFAGQEVVLGLTERFRLYANDMEVANNCTSFAIHDEFLLITTHSHCCRSVSRLSSLSELPALMSSTMAANEMSRQIERGARIVCAVPADTKLVLQMPRGNLEVIYPRSLVLSATRRHLDNLQFDAAFDLMKRHRINMNLMYDHDPAAFRSNTETFVRQLDLPANINLFLTDLSKEDVTRTMYVGGPSQVQCTLSADSVDVAKSTGSADKVDSVCEAVKTAVQKVDADRYALCILTSYVKKTVPELERALQHIQSLKGNSSSSVTTDDALHYLLYLVDVNDLYNVALGTYDFDLVLMVAEKSQKDPKEYLPQLNELQQLELNYQRYRIDVQLQRYERALGHIVNCGKERFPECRTFVCEHKLFSVALQLYSPNSEEYGDLSLAYGEDLMQSGHCLEAGLILSRAGKCERALTAFEDCLEWRHAITVATQLKFSDLQFNLLAKRLAKKLVEDRRHFEAAHLLDDYANDCEEAIVTLISGGEWDEALRLMYKYQRMDFVETDLKPALVETCTHQVALINTSSPQFTRHRDRLKVVREQKWKRRLEMEQLADGSGDADGVNHDLYCADTVSIADSDISFATSAVSSDSRYTRSTGRTSKSRSKREKKRWSLKEGSPYEEFALVEALRNLVEQTASWKAEIVALVKTLILFHRDADARQLQSQFDSYLRLISEAFHEIWNPSTSSSSTADTVHGPDSTANSIIQCRQAPPTNHPDQDAACNVPPSFRYDGCWQLSIV